LFRRKGGMDKGFALPGGSDAFLKKDPTTYRINARRYRIKRRGRDCWDALGQNNCGQFDGAWMQKKEKKRSTKKTKKTGKGKRRDARCAQTCYHATEGRSPKRASAPYKQAKTGWDAWRGYRLKGGPWGFKILQRLRQRIQSLLLS